MYKPTKYYDRGTSIWDSNIQDKFVKEFDKYFNGELNQVQLYSLFDEMLSIQYNRYKIMTGMYNRSKLVPASKFDWSNNVSSADSTTVATCDPREADGVPIFARQSPGITKENHKLHTAFDKKIVGNKSSYMAAIPPDITVDDDLKDLVKDRKLNKTILECSQSAVRGGTSYILAISPEGENDVYYKKIDEWEGISFYDSIKNKLKYSFRYYQNVDLLDTGEQDIIYMDMYTETEKLSFKYDGSWVMTSEPILHLFQGVPLVEFANNTERLGDVELTISLQDAHDILNSDLSSEITQLRLAYLYVKGAGLKIDQEFVDDLKRTGIWPLEEDGEVGFVEKNLTSQAIENLKADLERAIYEYSNSYNPNELGKEKAMTAFQIRQKLFGLEMSASETISMFTASLTYLMKITVDYYNEFANKGYDDDITVTFKKNVPSNIIEDLKGGKEAGLEIAQDILAEKMPFELDQERNRELLQQQIVDSPFMEDDDIGDDRPEELLVGEDGQPLEVDKDIVLNGAQIKSALDIVRAVKTGEISRDEGLNMIEIFFNIGPDKAQRILTSVAAR
jgi:SPP1 family phage portal protein